MRISTLWRPLALPLLLLVSAAAVAQPANDNLANATALTLGTPVTGSNVGATREAGEAFPSCAPTAADDGNQSIWYRYTPTTSGAATITAGGYDLILSVYTGTTFPLTEVACADATTGTESVTPTLTAGTQYYIRINGFAGATGSSTVAVNTPVPAPANDNLANAIAVTVGSVVTGTTAGATTETGEAVPVAACTPGQSPGPRNSVWWRFTPTASGAVTFSTATSTATATPTAIESGDTVLSIYTGTTHPLTQVACDDDAGPQFTSQVTNFVATAGTTYYIRVAGYNNANADVVLSVSGTVTVSQTLANGAGYRILSAPVFSVNVGTLAGLNLVQGVTGQYPAATDNVFTAYTGTYTGATNVTNVLAPGLGFFWYLFDRDCDPRGTTAPVCVAGSAPNTTGTSRSYTLATRPLTATGTESIVNTTVTFPSSTTNRFRLGGNPFATAMTADGVQSTIALQNVLHLYGPNAQGVFTYTTVPRDATTTLSTWQGFFIEQTATASATFAVVYDASKRVAGNGTIVGRSTASGTLALALTGTTADGVATADEAATVAVTDEATAGWDPDDASKMIPPAAPYALLAPVGEMDGQPYRQSVLSLPAADGLVTLAFTATHAGTYTITAASLGLPAGTTAEVRDVVTGTVADAVAGYTFTSDATDWTDRFVLDIKTDGIVANEPGAPTVFALAAPAPNPTSSAATVAFDVPEASAVNVSVYDLLGRRVAVLAQGQVAAGRHTARIEAGQFAPGVYVVRMEAGTFSATQRVTVVR